jgi:dipeptidyl aminopeptidase/acylaminoacyl peptidase
VNGQIAYVACGPSTIPFGPSTQCDIWVMNADGTGQINLTDTSDRDEQSPAWSPDGRMIVFMSQAQVPSCCGPWQIWAVNRDGTGATNLSNDPAVNDMGPSWSPDGTQILFFRSNELFGADLYTMPAPTSLPPSGPPLAATRVQTSTTLAAAASGATQLTSDGNAADPSWGRNPDAPPPVGQRTRSSSRFPPSARERAEPSRAHPRESDVAATAPSHTPREPR